MRSEGRRPDRSRAGSGAYRAGTRGRPMKALALPLIALLAACNQQAGGEPVTRIDLDNPGRDMAPSPTPTPTVASACTTVTFDGAQFTDCVADPSSDRITTMLGNPPYRSF